MERVAQAENNFDGEVESRWIGHKSIVQVIGGFKLEQGFFTHIRLFVRQSVVYITFGIHTFILVIIPHYYVILILYSLSTTVSVCSSLQNVYYIIIIIKCYCNN